MNYSQAYRQHKEISNVRTQIDEVKKEIKFTEWAYKIAFAATFVLYFVFVWMMYVSDLWGFSSWLVKNLSETAALVIYGSIAITLPLAMAMIKEIGYKHFAKYDNPWYIVAGVVGVLAFAGIIYESITSSSQQQHISVSAAEGSKSFELISATNPTVETGSLSSLIARAQQVVTRCQERLKVGKEKHCEGDKAKLKSYIDSEKRALQSAKEATTAAIETKAKAVKDLKEDAYKPAFKSIRDAMGVTISSAVMLVTLFISIIFEISHLLLIFFLKQKSQRLHALNAVLIDLETAYMDGTKKAFRAEDFSDDSVLDMNSVREQERQPAGFGQPAVTASSFQFGNIPTTSLSGLGANVGFSEFTPPARKNESYGHAKPVKMSGEVPGKSTKSDNKQFAGFINTNTKKGQPTSAKHPNHKRTPGNKKPLLGKADVQLDIPQLSTWNTELNKSGIDSPTDDVLNQPADKESIKRIINRGTNVDSIDVNRRVDTPDNRRVDKTAPIDVGTNNVDTKRNSGGLLAALANAKDEVERDILREGFALYTAWKAAILSKETTLSKLNGRKFISKHLCKARKKTMSPEGMDKLMGIWYAMGLNDETIINNPKYTGKPPHPKYLINPNQGA